jgi:hypothetical protein
VAVGGRQTAVKSFNSPALLCPINGNIGHSTVYTLHLYMIISGLLYSTLLGWAIARCRLRLVLLCWLHLKGVLHTFPFTPHMDLIYSQVGDIPLNTFYSRRNPYTITLIYINQFFTTHTHIHNPIAPLNAVYIITCLCSTFM